MARGRAQRRRRSYSKRYVGATAAQSVRAREVERERVQRMAEIDAAEKRAVEIGTPLSAAIAALLEDALRLARTLVLAPFRLAIALRRLTVAPA